ncbi:MAG: hypothetical protein WCE68_14280 [Anaerolineales bacterium]
MAEQKSGAQISAKAFIQAVVVLFILMMVAGILTRVIPAGHYGHLMINGRQIVDPNSFHLVQRPDYPIWRWFTAPVEVLFSVDGPTVIAIILFILLVGSAFAVMDKSGILKAVITRLVHTFGGRKYTLLIVIVLFFMCLGAFFGIFEETIPLVPIMIALSYYLGWDSLVGLGMSILAVNVGFSTAIFNPFTIGVAQKLAGLPLFSGAWPRAVLFVVVYGILCAFLTLYARKIDRKPEASPVYKEDLAERAKYGAYQMDDAAARDPRMQRAVLFLGIFIALILAELISSPFIPFLSAYALPVTGLLFVIGGIGAGLMTGAGRKTWKAAWEGFTGIAPAVLMLMMAASIKYIITSGQILDTILHSVAPAFAQTSPFGAAMIIYGFTMVVKLMISSGSAKALLEIPLLVPLADMVHVTRQVLVSTFCFGDGFSNLVYPTNAALLITLSLTVIPYSKWLAWILKLWIWVFLATVAFLALAVAFHYGPF